MLNLRIKVVIFFVLSNIVLISFVLGFFCYFYISNIKKALAQSVDAIAVRVYPNPDHLNALSWYKQQGFIGSPQSVIIDGYSGVRDGRTVYINAANVIEDTMYTNIYLITYNQKAEKATVDIFGHVLANWKFNANLINTGVCQKNTIDNCLIDTNCPVGDFCLSDKAKIIRDTKRLEDLAQIRYLLDKYHKKYNRYPKLSAGSYIVNNTISTWPSWNNVLAQELSLKLPTDPINTLGDCGEIRFNKVTCWDEAAKEFADSNTANSIIDLPAFSNAYIYTASSTGASYMLYSTTESGFNCPLNSAFCTNSNTIVSIDYTDSNRPPIFTEENLPIACVNQAYQGYISAIDRDGDVVNWTYIADPADQWSTWSGILDMNDSGVINQKKLDAIQVGDPGIYYFTITIADNSSSTSKRFSITAVNCDPPIINVIRDVRVAPIILFDRPTLVAPFNVDVIIGQSFDMTIESIDSESNYPLRYVFNNHPNGFDSGADSGLNTNQHDYNLSGSIVDQTKNYSVSISAIDTEDNKSEEVVFTVNLINHPPTITSVDTVSTIGCTDFHHQIIASDPDGHNLKYYQTGLPKGLSLNENTGEITGQAKVSANTFNVEIIVEDEYIDYTEPKTNARAIQNFVIIVTDESYTISLPNHYDFYTFPSNVKLTDIHTWPIIYMGGINKTTTNSVNYSYTTSPNDLISGLSFVLNPENGHINISAIDAIVGTGYDFSVNVIAATQDCNVIANTNFNFTVNQNEYCGDNITAIGFEECDDGKDGDDTNTCYDDCTNTYCGDTILQSPNGNGQNEECEDGNDLNSDACLNSCEIASCGDGFTQIGVEECDDGANGIDTDQCYDDCTNTYCGDGILQPMNGEQQPEECDDGNSIDGDGCNTNCQHMCGDGYVNTATEDCEGNNLLGNTCFSVGYYGGTLACDNFCNFDYTGCCTSAAGVNIQVCADNQHTTYFNGSYVSSASDWSSVQAVNVNVVSGRNVIAITASDWGSIRGVSATLNWPNPNCVNMTTNETTNWKCTQNFSPGWMNIDYDDSSWPEAIIQGTAGIREGNYISGVRQIWASGAGVGSTIYCRYTFGE